jgi:hypothetical protein
VDDPVSGRIGWVPWKRKVKAKLSLFEVWKVGRCFAVKPVEEKGLGESLCQNDVR